MNIIKDDQQVSISLAFTDAAGNPAAAPAAAPTWTTSDSAVGTVTANADGSAIVVAVGPLGSFQAQVAVIMDDGVVVTGTADFQVVADSATTVTLSVGTPESKSAAAPADTTMATGG